MYREQTVRKRYSQAFKQQIISDIESGKITISQARKKYAIIVSYTIQKWIKAAEKHHLINKVVRVRMPSEIERIKQLDQEKQKLESALARAHLKIDALQSVIELAEEDYKVDLKKSTGRKRSRSE